LNDEFIATEDGPVTLTGPDTAAFEVPAKESTDPPMMSMTKKATRVFKF
jgi:hypothetical protein